MINEHDIKDMKEFPQPPFIGIAPSNPPDYKGIKQNIYGSGTKYDGAKPPMALLDPDFLEEVGKVLGFGAQKYAAHNWRQGITVSRLISAAYRHLGAINKGENIDPESGLPHTGHLGCCIMFLDWTLKNKPDLDDRWKP